MGEMKTQSIQSLSDAATGERKLAAPQTNDSAFIGEEELLRRLGIARRTLFRLRTAGEIPFVRLGKRRVLFHWPSVEAALLRAQKEAA